MKVSLEDFKRLDIRIGEIVSAERIEGTTKLIRLEVNIGEGKRQLVAGIGKYYTPEELIGKQIPILVNLEPKKIKGTKSEGMILAAMDGERPVLLHPDRWVSPGSAIK